MKTLETITEVDEFVAGRGLRLEAVVVGGPALNLLGVISRPTNDCDILHPALPPAVAAAAREFAAHVRARGDVLKDDWLNNGPASLGNVLPAGWRQRVVPAFRGRAIELQSLGRDDLLRSKLFALCDRGLDLADCVALAPTADELRGALPWLADQDGNPGWPQHARETLADLAMRLGHAL